MTQGIWAVPIADPEHLARFIIYQKWVRSSDSTIRPEAFIPHPYPDLSVTRHLNLADDAIWSVGRDVATARQKTLYGRADLTAITVRQRQLTLEPDAVPGNPNHANMTGWPSDKPSQKIIALELAANSIYRRHQR